MDRQLVAFLDDRFRLVELRQVELRVDALRQQVEGDGHEIHVARPLPVSEQRSLDAVGSRHQAELGSRDGRASIVVWMHADDDALPARDVPLEPLDAVRVDVRWKRLDGRRQVDDHPLVGRRLPRLHDRLADLERELELGAVEALG